MKTLPYNSRSVCSSPPCLGSGTDKGPRIKMEDQHDSKSEPYHGWEQQTSTYQRTENGYAERYYWNGGTTCVDPTKGRNGHRTQQSWYCHEDKGETWEGTDQEGRKRKAPVVKIQEAEPTDNRSSTAINVESLMESKLDSEHSYKANDPTCDPKKTVGLGTKPIPSIGTLLTSTRAMSVGKEGSLWGCSIQ